MCIFVPSNRAQFRISVLKRNFKFLKSVTSNYIQNPFQLQSKMYICAGESLLLPNKSAKCYSPISAAVVTTLIFTCFHLPLCNEIGAYWINWSRAIGIICSIETTICFHDAKFVNNWLMLDCLCSSLMKTICKINWEENKLKNISLFPGFFDSFYSNVGDQKQIAVVNVNCTCVIVGTIASIEIRLPEEIQSRSRHKTHNKTLLVRKMRLVMNKRK